MLKIEIELQGLYCCPALFLSPKFPFYIFSTHLISQFHIFSFFIKKYSIFFHFDCFNLESKPNNQRKASFESLLVEFSNIGAEVNHLYVSPDPLSQGDEILCILVLIDEDSIVRYVNFLT